MDLTVGEEANGVSEAGGGGGGEEDVNRRTSLGIAPNHNFVRLHDLLDSLSDIAHPHVDSGFLEGGK